MDAAVARQNRDRDEGRVSDVTTTSRRAARRWRSTGSSGSTSRAYARTGSPAPRRALAASELGALLLFDPNNIRYVTSTHIGEWARDKNARFALLPRGDDPILWDFGSAARAPPALRPWLPEESFRAGVAPMRGAMPDETGVPDGLAAKIQVELHERGLDGEPVGMDMPDLVTIEALQRAGLQVTDGSRVMLEARKIKTDDEIACSTTPAGSSTRSTRRSTGCSARASTRTRSSRARSSSCSSWAPSRSRRSTPSRATAATRIRTCSPTGSCGRATRPSSTSSTRSWATGRATTARSTSARVSQPQLDAYKQCREWLDDAIELVRPGRPRTRSPRCGRPREELGFDDEESCFGLQFGHGLGVGLYEPPMISRVHSLRAARSSSRRAWSSRSRRTAPRPTAARPRASRRRSSSPRTGTDVLTRFPAEELLVAGKTYVRGADLDRARGGSHSTV